MTLQNPEQRNNTEVPNTVPTHVAAEHSDAKDIVAASVPTRRRLGKRGIAAIAGGTAGVLLAGGIALGLNISNNNGEHKGDVPTSDPKATSEVQVPNEAKQFITRNGKLYTDALATWYAENAYEKANPGQGFVLGESYITGYDFNSQPFANGATSPLGFTVERMAPDQPITLQATIDQFNGSIPNLDRLLNLLAKNPSSDALKVITDEFSKYTGLGNTAQAESLVNFFASITQQYGSNANYSINPAIKDNGEGKTDTTVFVNDAPAIEAVDANNKVTAFGDNVNLSIKVQTYNDKGELSTQDILINDIGFTVNQATNYNVENSGYVGMGVNNK